MRKRLLVAGAFIGVGACSDVTEPARKATSGPQVSASVATTSCAITFPMPSPIQTWVPVGLTVRGSVCSINWEMTEPPAYSTDIVARGFVFRQFDIPSQVAGLPIPTFAVSYNNLATQGLYQNGPIEVTFSQRVDAFTMDFLENCGGTTGSPCNMHLHRIVARNDSGRVLLDTVAGSLVLTPPTQHVLVTIERAGIRSVSVHGDSVGKAIDLVTTTVIPGWYTLSFRPDSTCPPSRDSLLDSKQVRDVLRAEMASSLANGGVERGGEIWKMTDGTYRAFPQNDPSATPCSFAPPTTVPPPGAAFGRPSGLYHTHPAFPNDIVPAACGSGLAGNKFAPNANGGGSLEDWNYSDNGMFIPIYAYTKQKLVYRLDPGTPASQRKYNPNRWKSNGPGCFK